MKKEINTSFFRLISLMALLLMTLSLSLFTHRLIAQSKQFTEDSPYELLYDKENTQVYLSVNFIDTSTRQILNSFDLVENNPFNKLEYPELIRNSFDQPNKVYSFKNIPLDKIDLKFCNLVIKENIDRNNTYAELTGWNFYQAVNLENYLVVHYYFSLGGGESVLGRSDAIFIFNQAGDLLHKITGFDTNVREWGLTENGRYFSYAYGSALDESLNSFSSVGYKIYDLEERKVVYQEDFGYEFNEMRTGARDNLIAVTGFSIDYFYIFLDFSKNKKYTRTFTNKELGLWKELTKEGLVLYVGKRNSDSFKLLKFETDFAVSTIN